VKIGVMLRHMGQHGGGVLVYTHDLLREMLALDTPHEFVLLYQEPSWLGSYNNGNGGRVRELALGKAPTTMWDQWLVPQAEKKEKFDLIFNPKYSLPLLSRSRTVFVCHGLDWYVMPRWSKLMDRLNHRYLIPRYCQKADAIIAVSNTARQHLIEYLGVEEERIHTIYVGVNEAFGRPVPPETLEEVKHTYRLPDRFFLYCGQIYPPKNFGRLIQAYAQVGPELGLPLVVAGGHTWLCEDEISLIDQLGISQWVLWPGWIDHKILPAFYALAEALVLPSLYESFGIPILEAMSSGCPIVTTNRYGPVELAGEAAILVNPEEVESIADGMRRVVSDQNLRQQLIRAGRERVKDFSWKKCAKETMTVFERVGVQYGSALRANSL
jgi:glycosyltransferase involved in cell wall biosynthesis